ncbi:hypothetical protein L6452_08516 [Arctium lappa]|uniref:Uncharacterized protein n=1 Tax=Arctium lappa TaxID=4217 RepID=A0ACB9DI52_ARCLA|nr:hypothetical protein L6452_08516 [Arctium lappa]
MSSHPYSASFSGLSDHEAIDIELVENLLLSAEKVAQHQFERSSKLLDWCDGSCYSLGNLIQRLVHYFSNALREKIARETGRIRIYGSGKKHLSKMEGKMTTPNPIIISIYLSSVKRGRENGEGNRDDFVKEIGMIWFWSPESKPCSPERTMTPI